VWPDPRVVALVEREFIPARLHVKDQAADFNRFGERYGAHWTPTILGLDPDGVERHRIEGFLPADDLLAQLTLGLGHLAFQAERWGDAQRFFQEVAEKYPDNEAAPEALYWAGVSRFKAAHENTALVETAAALGQRYAGSSWAKKASVWSK